MPTHSQKDLRPTSISRMASNKSLSMKRELMIIFLHSSNPKRITKNFVRKGESTVRVVLLEQDNITIFIYFLNEINEVLFILYANLYYTIKV